jgi:hypothetical protein
LFWGNFLHKILFSFLEEKVGENVPLVGLKNILNSFKVASVTVQLGCGSLLYPTRIKKTVFFL